MLRIEEECREVSAEPFTSEKEINERFHKCFHVMSVPWGFQRTFFVVVCLFFRGKKKKNVDVTDLENHPVNVLLLRKSDKNAKVL